MIRNQASLESPNASVHVSPDATIQVTAGQLPNSGFTPVGPLQRILPYTLIAGGVLLLLLLASQHRRRAF